MDMLLHRFKSLTNSSIWILVLPAFAVLFWADPSMAKTMLQWTMFALVLAGIAVAISMVIFPYIDLERLIRNVIIKGDPLASAIVIASVVVFVGQIVLALVQWAKA